MLKRLFNQKSTINNSVPFGDPQSGLYHYRRENINEKSRIHLRLDPDGHGTLIVNANRILHLNPTAALMAYFALEETSEQDAVRLIRQKYHVDAAQARADLGTVRGQIEELVRPDGACPIHELGLETVMPFSARPTAPYRLDLALTYRCNNDCAHCYNVEHPSLTPGPSPKDGRGERGVRAELSTGDWKRVLDKAWGLGIPHIIFTGGEPTMCADLPELVAHAEKNGQITGLNTNARRLSDPRYVEKLVAAGLDHVQITVESNDAEVHDRMVRTKGAFPQTVKGLKNALASPLYVMTNTTMLRTNAHTIPATLDFLADTGVPTVGLNALIYSGRGSVVGTGLAESELTPLLEVARQKTAARGQRLIWYTPTQYCGFDPMALDLGVKGCTAALYNMCVEPDGGVLPCQSYYHQLGNLLADDWDSIWNHDLAVRLRERQGLPEKCNGCALLAECGGGCPLPRVPCENRDYAVRETDCAGDGCMSKGHWVKELPAEIMVCDSGGILLEMNVQAEALFADDGGRGLLGTNVLACHPQPALGKLEGLLDKQTANSYFNTENGEKRFFFQSPWYKEGKYAGFVEISFGVPEEIPHFIRE